MTKTLCMARWFLIALVLTVFLSGCMTQDGPPPGDIEDAQVASDPSQQSDDKAGLMPVGSWIPHEIVDLRLVSFTQEGDDDRNPRWAFTVEIRFNQDIADPWDPDGEPHRLTYCSGDGRASHFIVGQEGEVATRHYEGLPCAQDGPSKWTVWLAKSDAGTDHTEGTFEWDLEP